MGARILERLWGKTRLDIARILKLELICPAEPLAFLIRLAVRRSMKIIILKHLR